MNDNEKYEFAFMGSFPIILNLKMCSKCPGIKLEITLISRTIVVHKTISSFQVVVLMGTTKKCTKVRNARSVRAKVLLFLIKNMQICGIFVLVFVVVA